MADGATRQLPLKFQHRSSVSTCQTHLSRAGARISHATPRGSFARPQVTTMLLRSSVKPLMLLRSSAGAQIRRALSTPAEATSRPARAHLEFSFFPFLLSASMCTQPTFISRSSRGSASTRISTTSSNASHARPRQPSSARASSEGPRKRGSIPFYPLSYVRNPSMHFTRVFAL